MPQAAVWKTGWRAGVTQKQGIHKEAAAMVQAKDPVASARGMVVKRYTALGSNLHS